MDIFTIMIKSTVLMPILVGIVALRSGHSAFAWGLGTLAIAGVGSGVLVSMRLLQPMSNGGFKFDDAFLMITVCGTAIFYLWWKGAPATKKSNNKS